LLRENLVTIAVDSGKVMSVNFNTEIYTEFIKHLYCPKMYDPSKLTFEDVRQMSIQLSTSKSKEVVRNAQLWMPLKCVIERLSRNVSCLINYYMSAGRHFALLPDFLTEGCLTKLLSGEIEYDIGPEAYAKDVQCELKICEEDLMQKMNAAKKKSTKRKIPRTPQKPKRWKLKPQTSTPK
jgi:hypothetical protein